MNYCNTGRLSQNALYLQQKGGMGMDDDATMTCTMCGAQFKSQAELDTHNAEVHPEMK